MDEPEPITQLAPFLETRLGEEDDAEIFATQATSNLEAIAVTQDAEYPENGEAGSGASSESEDNENKMVRREEFIVDAVGMNVSFCFLLINIIYFLLSFVEDLVFIKIFLD